MTAKRILSALAITAAACLPGQANAAGGVGEVTDYSFSFEGPFGTYDRLQLQRGYQIYANVCAGCHGLKFLPFRSLGNDDGPAFPAEQVAAIAANYFCMDADTGEERECKPSDRFPAGGVANAPDLTLMAKARAGFHGPYGLGLNQLFKGMGGAEYIASLLMGYTGKEKEEAGVFLWENSAYGGYLAMQPPLTPDTIEFEIVTYQLFDENGQPLDETAGIPEQTIEQMSLDVAAFLMWTAEPTMTERKQAGLRNIIMLVILAVLLYFTNKRLWAPIKRED